MLLCLELGALTRGDRRAASGVDLSEYNFDSPLGRKSLRCAPAPGDEALWHRCGVGMKDWLLGALMCGGCHAVEGLPYHSINSLLDRRSGGCISHHI